MGCWDGPGPAGEDDTAGACTVFPKPVAVVGEVPAREHETKLETGGLQNKPPLLITSHPVYMNIPIRRNKNKINQSKQPLTLERALLGTLCPWGRGG